MAVTSSAVSVGTEATSLGVSGGTQSIEVLVQNLGSAPVFVGGEGVTTDNGIRVFPGDVIGLNAVVVSKGDLFAVAEEENQDVRVLEVS